jgi:quercetin dioxygenase-like cupin family protein
MKRHALTAIWLGCVTAAVFGQAPQQKSPPAGPLLDDKHLTMQAEQVQPNGTTPILGDPAKSGLYVVRTQLAPNAKVRPRYFDQDRVVTVLKGTWWVGEGEVFRPEKVSPVREGGVMYFPANMKHFEVAGSAEVVLQVVGNGPVKAVHAEVDASGQMVAIGGPYPEDAVEEGRGGRYGRNRGRRGAPPPPVDPDQTPPSNPQLLKELQQPK